MIISVSNHLFYQLAWFKQGTFLSSIQYVKGYTKLLQQIAIYVHLQITCTDNGGKYSKLSTSLSVVSTRSITSSCNSGVRLTLMAFIWLQTGSAVSLPCLVSLNVCANWCPRALFWGPVWFHEFHLSEAPNSSFDKLLVPSKRNTNLLLMYANCSCLESSFFIHGMTIEFTFLLFFFFISYCILIAFA